MGMQFRVNRFVVLAAMLSLVMAMGGVAAQAQDPPSPTPPDRDRPSLASSAPAGPAQAPTGTIVYAEDTFTDTFESFDLGQPETPSAISAGSDSFAGDSADDGLIYLIDDNDVFQSVTVTGMRTTIDTLTATPFSWSGLAWDQTTSTMYASRAVDCHSPSELYTIDLGTGATTLIGTVDVADCLIAIAFDDDGNLFGYDILTDLWLSIDPSTAIGTEIGPIGFNAFFEQGLDYDSASDTFYMSAFNSTTAQAELRTVDASTGATTLVGLIHGDGDAQYGWLAIDPQAGPPPPAVPTCFGQPATIVGTAGNDVLTGTSGPDVIVGLDGDDTIRGLAGDDIICGNAGNDQLLGGLGDDQIAGGLDDDYLHGGQGDDLLGGNKGEDQLHGKQGNDTLKGGDGVDHMYGDDGDDVLAGNNGDDRMFGNAGVDRFNGGPGADRVHANDGVGGESVDGGPDVDVCTTDPGDVVSNCP